MIYCLLYMSVQILRVSTCRLPLPFLYECLVATVAAVQVGSPGLELGYQGNAQCNQRPIYYLFLLQ